LRAEKSNERIRLELDAADAAGSAAYACLIRRIRVPQHFSRIPHTPHTAYAACAYCRIRVPQDLARMPHTHTAAYAYLAYLIRRIRVPQRDVCMCICIRRSIYSVAQEAPAQTPHTHTSYAGVCICIRTYIYSVAQEAPARNSRGDVCAFYNERKCQGAFFFFDCRLLLLTFFFFEIAVCSSSPAAPLRP
jgi:hypothetical protein